MKYIYLFVVIFSLYFIGIKAENEIVDKQKVLSIKIQSCKEDKDCTGYSNSCNNNVGLCMYTFNCHENSCILPDANTEFSSNNEKPATGMILEACTTESYKNGGCLTRACNGNSDCFSGNCFNSTCIINENLPLIQCSNDEHYENISCGKAPLEKCTKDEDCFCDTCDEDKTCNYYKKQNYDVAMTFIFINDFIICAVIIIIIIILCVLMYKCCNKKH